MVRIGNKQNGVKYTKRDASYVIIEHQEDNKIAIATTIDGDYFFLGGGIEGSGYSIKNINFFDKVTAWADGGERGPLDVTASVYIAEFDKKVAEPIEKDHRVLWINANEYKNKLYHEYQRYILKKYMEFK